MRSIADGNKTEKATQKRRKDERKKGNIFKSKEITSAIGVITVFGGLWCFRGFLYSHIVLVFTYYFQGFAAVESLEGMAPTYLSSFAIQILILSLPLLFVSMATGIALDAFQSKMHISFSQVKPDFKKLNPITGLKRIITLRSVVEVFKSMLKVAVVGFVAYSEVKSNLTTYMRLSELGVGQSLHWIIQTIVYIAIKAGIAMLILGVLDYLYQWWEYERKIMMSKQEIKDEFKQTEGDPQFKGFLKDRQRKASMRRMMQGIYLADAVIKNPTHYAIAIKYDEKKGKAPIVIAKGQDYLALKIIKEAQKHDIVIMENPPLARGLYAAVEIGQEIPAEYYQAVAEVLVFVYNIKRRAKRR